MRCAGTAALWSVALVGALGAGAWPLADLLPPFLEHSLDELVQLGSTTCEALPLDLLFSRSYTLELPLTNVVEFTRAGSRRYRVSAAHRRVRRAAPRALVLYVPGWWNTPTDQSSSALVGALLTRHPVVLVLDTRPSFCRGYLTAASRVKPLAHLLYSFIKNLHGDGFPMSSIHLIGFSLGAHVAGVTGKLVQKGLNRKLGQITALDPAKPCFARSKFRLEKRDAAFVHVIHSSSGVLGLEEAVGHVDVYVNGVHGTHPECRGEGVSLECAHAQAWKTYSTSVLDERSFMGQKCASWEELVDGACTGNETALGYACSPTQRGLFLHRSEDDAPRTPTQLKVFNPLDILFKWR